MDGFEEKKMPVNLIRGRNMKLERSDCKKAGVAVKSTVCSYYFVLLSLKQSQACTLAGRRRLNFLQ